jgi:predicted NBD/HSP70 family sugar kinase
MADQTLAKFVNELRILTLLRTQGQATRADIARRLSLTPATITRLITGLADRNLVYDVQDMPRTSLPREPGRPGVSVALNPEGAYFLGVEIGVGNLRLALIDLCADVVNAVEFRVSNSISPEEAMRTITDHLALLEHDIRFRGKVQSLGVTVPGLVSNEGHIVNLPILGWKDINLLNLLKTAVDLPVFVENNANAAAFGSVYTQADIASDCTIFLKLGTGCGGAAIINGRLMRGAKGTAGEFGHVRIADRGSLCNCGQTGCLESFVNLRALARSYYGTEGLTEAEFAALPALVASRAEAGDTAARKSLSELSHFLSLGIASLINTFNPTVVLLGGSLRPVIAMCLEDIQRKVADAIVPGMTVPEFKMSAHGNLECAVGAATVAHHHAFDISWTDLTSHKEPLQPTPG